MRKKQDCFVSFSILAAKIVVGISIFMVAAIVLLLALNSNVGAP